MTDRAGSGRSYPPALGPGAAPPPSSATGVMNGFPGMVAGGMAMGGGVGGPMGVGPVVGGAMGPNVGGNAPPPLSGQGPGVVPHHGANGNGMQTHGGVGVGVGPPPMPRGPPLRTPSGGGLPRPGTGTSATYAQAKHAQLTLKDLETARRLMIAEIESNGECAQSALKDLVCILKQMGRHADATTTIMTYRSAWADDDRRGLNHRHSLLTLFWFFSVTRRLHSGQVD